MKKPVKYDEDGAPMPLYSMADLGARLAEQGWYISAGHAGEYANNLPQATQSQCLLASIAHELHEVAWPLKEWLARQEGERLAREWVEGRAVKHGDPPRSVLLWLDQQVDSYARFGSKGGILGRPWGPFTPHKSCRCRPDYDKWMRRKVASKGDSK